MSAYEMAALVDGPLVGQVVRVAETTVTYRAEKPKPLSIIPTADDLDGSISLVETVDYHIELWWLTDAEKLLAYPYRIGWSERRPAAWEMPRLIDPDFYWIIRQQAHGAVPITAEQIEQAREAAKPPIVDQHDHDWCRESNGADACIDGAHYGMCGHPNCYGACEWRGDCPCKCHVYERVVQGRPILLRKGAP